MVHSRQYGPSAAGGWDYWAIASWYVTLTDDVVYSNIQTVNAGDVIFGNMTKVGPSSWYINTVDVTTGTSSYVTVTRPILATQPWICTALPFSPLSSDRFLIDLVPM